MVLVDIILLIFLSLFLILGFYLGLVKMVLQLLASVLSIIIAIKFHQTVADNWTWLNFGFNGLGRVIAFFLILSIANFTLGFLFKIIGKILKIITSLPLISFLNRILGGVLGLVQGFFILGALIFVMFQNSLSHQLLDLITSNSDLAPLLVKTVSWLSPFVPKAIENISSVIN